MQSTKASFRYAKAIFNLAKEQNIVDDTEYNMRKYLVLGWYIYNIKKN